MSDSVNENVDTGFTDVDRLLNGLRPGDLVVVGGRPSLGKTSFALGVVKHTALHAGRPVALFSLEMSAEQIAMRIISTVEKTNVDAIRQDKDSAVYGENLSAEISMLASSNIFIDDTAYIGPAVLKSHCLSLKDKHGLDLIVVDYLEMMSVDDDRFLTCKRQSEEIVRALKRVAQDICIPIIICTQMSRANSQRINKRPLIKEIWASDTIMQEADAVLLLHREEYYDRDTPDKNIAEVIVCKQRDGLLGTARLFWESENATFHNLPEV